MAKKPRKPAKNNPGWLGTAANQALWAAQQDQVYGPGSSTGTPSPVVTPFNFDVEQQISGMAGDRDAQQAQIAGQRATLQKRFFDPTDPYSRQNQLKEQLRITQAGLTNTAAQTGHLYSGVAGTQQANALQDDALRDRQMRDEFADTDGDLAGRSAEIDRLFNANKAGLLRDAAREFAADPMNTPAPPVGPQIHPTGPDPAKRRKKKKGKR